MKIPLIWLKDYVNTSKSAGELAASFTQLGLMLDKPLDDNNVLDLEHRMDRSDWLSIIGCARDLAAFEGIMLNLPRLTAKTGKPVSPADKIEVTIHTPAVRRFKTRLIKNIKVGDSPAWLKDRLAAYGMDSINNIVDITNFVMVEYGQPMHAQDIAQLPGKDITIRPAKIGESLTTLLGTEIKLTADTHVLTSGNKPIVILGVVGGKETGVNQNTKDIILDAGNYDSRIIRRSSRQLKIINETVSRDDKFLDPRTIDLALSRATDLILELAGGTYYENDDYYPSPVTPQSMTLRMSRLHLLSGMELSLEKAKKILQSLCYVITEESGDSLTVEVPYFRTDIEVEDDLVADILRIYNYKNIPVSPLNTPVPTDLTPSIYRFEDKLRDLLVAQGLHEHITSSLTTSNGESDTVVLANALSSDQNALRRDLIPGLTHVLSTYSKHKLTGTGVFEIGKVFRKNTTQYLEGRLLTVIGGEVEGSSLTTLLSSLGITKYQLNNKSEIIVNKKIVGTLTSTSYTLVTDALMPHIKDYTGIVSEFDHTKSLDISLLVPKNLTYFDIVECISTIKSSWISITSKAEPSQINGLMNYLLTFTWNQDSALVEIEKDMMLKTLLDKLSISSKS